jgi:hypothetical protein
MMLPSLVYAIACTARAATKLVPFQIIVNYTKGKK